MAEEEPLIIASQCVAALASAFAQALGTGFVVLADPPVPAGLVVATPRPPVVVGQSRPTNAANCGVQLAQPAFMFIAAKAALQAGDAEHMVEILDKVAHKEISLETVEVLHVEAMEDTAAGQVELQIAVRASNKFGLESISAHLSCIPMTSRLQAVGQVKFTAARTCGVQLAQAPTVFVAARAAPQAGGAEHMVGILENCAHKKTSLAILDVLQLGAREDTAARQLELQIAAKAAD